MLAGARGGRRLVRLRSLLRVHVRAPAALLAELSPRKERPCVLSQFTEEGVTLIMSSLWMELELDRPFPCRGAG